MFFNSIIYDDFKQFLNSHFFRMPRIAILLSVILLAIIWADVSYGQRTEPVRTHHHPTLDAIEQARQQGRLTNDEAVLQTFYAAYQTENLREEFRQEPETPIKCMVPAIQRYYQQKNALLAKTVQEVEAMTQQPTLQAEQTHISESGNFEFHYETEGPNAVPAEDTDSNGIPDYIEKAAAAADSSYSYQVETLGFEDFIRRPNPYEIYFEESGFYGTTNISSDGSTTYIIIHRNFDGFPENSHPDGDVTGALYATIAHEIKHAIQYATNRWEGSAGSFNWSEMDATLMEEIVHDDVNDYYHYIKEKFDSSEPLESSIFGSPQSATPGAYYHITWMLYYAEKYGMDFWVDVWKQYVDDRNKPFQEAVDDQLQVLGSGLDREHLQNHMWHMASGPAYAGPEYGFEEREVYPNPNFNHVLTTTPDSLMNRSVPAFAANYIDATVVQVAPGQPIIQVESSIEGVGLGVIGYFRDGTTRQEFILNPNSLFQSIQTTWNWEDLLDISIAVVNTNRTGTAVYSVKILPSIPEDDQLVQNYPNPFNPTTRINFTLNEQKHVRLEVYDGLGRKIQTLVDETRNSGYYSINFDGSGLASGIYYYRLRTGELTRTKKMILIK